MKLRVFSLVALLGIFAVVHPISPAQADLHDGVPVVLADFPVNPGFASANINYVGTIPLDNPGVSAALRVDDRGRTLMYVSGVPGLSIYDVSDPAAPLVLGHLPLPNWENEDISISGDGKTALMTEFTGIFYLHVFDVSDPTLPVLTATKPLQAAGHIADCMDHECDVVWGSDGEIFDLSDKANPIRLSTKWTSRMGIPPGHNINIDEAGYAITDTTPMSVIDVPNMSDADLRNPQPRHRLAQSVTASHRDNRTAYQHNNKRPRANDYAPNSTSTFRPGDLVMGNGETNFTGVPFYEQGLLAPTDPCFSGAGPFATWDARNVLEGQSMTVADVFRPVSGNYADNGDPAVNGIGCSGHWFTVREHGDDYLVSAAWYEHGTRVLHVDGKTGKISNRGFWQPGVGSASQSFWLGDYIYTVDYGRGIDIVEFDRDAALVPTTAEFDESWLRNAGAVNQFAAAERLFCSLAVVDA